jgi:outer membrane protein
MKKIFIFVALISFSISAFAADKSELAVVDIQKVLQDSEAAKDIREQIKVQRDKYQAEITKQEEDLRSSEQKLTQQKSILSQDAFKEKREEFKEKLTKAQRDVQEKRSQLDNALNDSIGEVQKVVFQIISDMAKEKGFKIAIPTSQILYSEPGLNITEDVLKKLNDKLPKVKVKTNPVPVAADPKKDAKKTDKKEEPKKN